MEIFKYIKKTSSLEREREKEREQNTPKESDYIGNSAIHTAKSTGASKVMHSSEIFSIASLTLSHKPAI